LLPARKREPPPVSFALFEEACAFLKARGASGTEAMSKARFAHPELFAEYQAKGAEPTEKVAPRQRPLAVQQFDALVTAIVERDGVKRSEAMRKARREHKAAFEDYQNG
jgi:hypothetical protein